LFCTLSWAAKTPAPIGIGNVSRAITFYGLQGPQFVVGDFNEDGYPDVVVLDDIFNVAITLLGNGTGTFRVGTGLELDHSIQLTSITAGDIDCDGHLDVIVSSQQGVFFLHGKGDGSFANAVQVAGPGDLIGGAPVAIGDIDGDGNPDFAVGGNTTRVYFGDGTGKFEGPILVPGPGGPFLGQSIAIADLDGDGRPDLITLAEEEGIVSVHWNAGNRTFEPRMDLALAPPNPSFVAATAGNIAVGDLNGDGLGDFVVETNEGGFDVLLQTDPRSFARSTVADPIFVYGSAAIALGDLDGDGIPDVATGNGGLWVEVFHGDGAGGFTPAGQYSTMGPSAMAISDVTGDGRPDLVVLGQGGLQVLGATPAGVLDQVATMKSSDCDQSALVDLNRDGHADIVCASGTVFLGDGAGHLTLAAPIPAHFAIADFNGDGWPDLINFSLGVQLNDGHGNYNTVASFLHKDLSTPIDGTWLTGDFNGDGKTDLAIVILVPPSITLLFGNGDGTFQNGTNYPLSIPEGSGFQLASISKVADLNGDGRDDFILIDGSLGGLGATVFSGPGGVPGSVAVFDPGADGGYGHSEDAAVADLNGDGKLDLAIAISNSDQSVLLGHGDGTFTVLGTLPTDDHIRRIEIGDLNGDGIPDLAFLGDSEITFFANDGTAHFVGPTSFIPAAGNFSGMQLLDDPTRDVVTLSASWTSLVNTNTVTPGYVTVLKNTTGAPTRLRVGQPASACLAIGQPIPSFSVTVEDDADSPVRSAKGSVIATLVGGQVATGAQLTGTREQALVNGTATFGDLAVTAGARGFHINCALTGTTNAITRPFSQALQASIHGEPLVPADSPSTFSADAGYDSYRWYVDNANTPVGTLPTYSATLAPGDHDLRLAVSQDNCRATTNLAVQAELVRPSIRTSKPPQPAVVRRTP
jgi:hypothetical protein